MNDSPPLLEINDLRVEFDTRQGVAVVLDDLSLSLGSRESLGLVGESGCGKSMTALSVLGLVPCPPGRVAGGQIVFEGRDLLRLSERAMRGIRGREIAMIFQEPMTSLNPVISIGRQVAETIMAHEKTGKRAAFERATEMLSAVGFSSPARMISNYPHQLSGGMRQRVMIAMAMACRPKLIIADEPTTALDVTVQAQIFDLLKELQQETASTFLLITHDIGVIAEMVDRVAVMYAGLKVEEGPTDWILNTPCHPYTRGLIACVPHLEEEVSPQRPPLTEIPGAVPSMLELKPGCPFAPRCPQATEHCRRERPPVFSTGPGSQARCWLAQGDGR